MSLLLLFAAPLVAPVFANPSQALWDWMACTSIVDDAGVAGQPQLGAIMINAPNSPYAAGSTPLYRAVIVDPYGTGIPAGDFSSLTLTIVDTLTGAIVNDCDAVNILNTGRGTVSDAGALQIALESGDTILTMGSQAQRSMIIKWSYTSTGPQATTGSGVHQVNFIVQALAGN